MLIPLSTVALLCARWGACETAAVRLRLSNTTHSLQAADLGDGVYEVRTTGEDPYVVCEQVTQPFEHDRLFVLAFDYQCPDGLDFVEVFYGSPFHGDNRVVTDAVPAATDWRPFAVNLKTAPRGDWGPTVVDFRLDFGSGGQHVLKLRNLRLRAMTAEEVETEQRRKEEEKRQLEQLQRRIEQTLIAPAKIKDPGNMLSAVHSFADAGNVTKVSVVGKELDLATLVREYALQVSPSVSLPPALVVGEGDSPKNHTVVRILNRYGICEVQFLAYPAAVRGGVQVAAGKVIDGQPCIVTAPLSDAGVRSLRVFSRHGNWLSTLKVPPRLAPPYVVAVGDFLRSNVGDEIAVASATAEGDSLPVLLLSGSGKQLKTLEVRLPVAAKARLTLSTRSGKEGASLIVYPVGRPSFYLVDPESETVGSLSAELGANCTGVYRSAFADRPFAATVREPSFSTLQRLSADGRAEQRNVGERENLFWFTTGGPFKDVPEAKYTRHSLFAHLRTDFGSPVAGNPDFSRTDADYWAGKPYLEQVTSRLKSYDTDPPGCWEPCFTHRWFAGQAKKWASALDEETGLPKYTLVDRDNKAGTYGEFGNTDAFVTGTYAPGLEAIDCLYLHPQRLFLHELVKRFRANPEHFVAVEPNHEMEINAESETTHGDYNPAMIRGFYRYLLDLYGTLENVNRLFGAAFTPARFDAPRDLRRGPWDAYSEKNPYYLVWMRFMNYTIYRVVAGTYREALLAGFPPEAIKCHQIPDHYAIASLAAFSKPARRTTPIDWNLNAGVGFGCTKYGVWFNQPHNCVQGPNSSGFDAMVIGEYQSLHPDADVAFQQLQYLRDHGVQFIHCMAWPASHDRGFNASLKQALNKLVHEDKPRLGLTGGTGQVRAVNADGRQYDLVSLGMNRENTGLLKSVNADGSWEGSVYVVPFHAHVGIQPLAEQPVAGLSAEPLSYGPFDAIDAGNLVDLSFLAKSAGKAPSALSLKVYHHGIELPEQRLVLPLTPEWRHCRLQVRVQIDTDDLRLELGSGDAGGDSWLKDRAQLKDLTAVRHTEKTTKLKKGVFAGERHEGGVTFDVLPEG